MIRHNLVGHVGGYAADCPACEHEGRRPSDEKSTLDRPRTDSDVKARLDAVNWSRPDWFFLYHHLLYNVLPHEFVDKRTHSEAHHATVRRARELCDHEEFPLRVVQSPQPAPLRLYDTVGGFKILEFMEEPDTGIARVENGGGYCLLVPVSLLELARRGESA